MRENKGLWKRLTGLALALVLMINLIPITGNAEEVYSDELNETELSAVSEEFEQMSIEQLNETIDDIVSNSEKFKGESVPTGNVQQAWLAAAKIAKKKGYPCAATLVENSVHNKAYSESSNGQGLFGAKITKTSVFKDRLSKAKSSKKSTSGSFAFTKSINSDLFYALHNVNYTMKRSVEDPITHKAPYMSTITDTFDFAYDNNYDSLFTTLVNNWAWLCQNTKVLKKIPVKIDINFL